MQPNNNQTFNQITNNIADVNIWDMSHVTAVTNIQSLPTSDKWTANPSME